MLQLIINKKKYLQNILLEILMTETKELNIDTFTNGFTLTQVNCIDLPIAGAASSYDYDNYFYYCFYLSVYYNWGNLEELSSLQMRNIILCKLGLVIKPHIIHNNSLLIDFVKQSIDKKIPLLMLSPYSTLYYTPYYISDSEGNQGIHGTLISGYNSYKSIIIMKDNMPISFRPIAKIINADPLYTMYIKEKMLLDIWNETNDYYKKTSDETLNTIYTIEKTEEPKIRSYEHAIKFFLNNYDLIYDNLITLVEKFEQYQEMIKDNARINQLTLSSSLQAFFSCLEKYVSSINNDIGATTIVNDFKNEYIDQRTNILSLLYAYVLRNKELDKFKKEDLIARIHNFNKELLCFIIDICSDEKRTRLSRTRMENYALTAIVTADSEYKDTTNHVFKAANSVNGRSDIYIEDMWMSKCTSPIHWLEVELVEPISATTFRIVHSGLEILNTSDFEIQGSNDNVSWEILVSIIGNKKPVTVHSVEGISKFKYYRLYITKPGECEFYARIYEFEVWGESVG